MANLTDQTTAETTTEATGADVFPKSLFPLGRLCVTPGAARAMAEWFGVYFGTAELFRLVKRHNTGDWGDIDDDDRGLNEQALQIDARVFSVYKSVVATFWIITEADRSYTTILLPSEY